MHKLNILTNWLVERKAEHEEKKRREHERLERLLQIELKKLRQLTSDVLGWRGADEIRAFVAEVNSLEELTHNPDAKEKLMQWSAWALAKTDRLDPMKRPLESLLDYLYGNSENGI